MEEKVELHKSNGMYYVSLVGLTDNIPRSNTALCETPAAALRSAAELLEWWNSHKAKSVKAAAKEL